MEWSVTHATSKLAMSVGWLAQLLLESYGRKLIQARGHGLLAIAPVSKPVTT